MDDLRRDLLVWYDTHQRDLPWRRGRDPYAVLVSEAMLQQTRVAVALPYYARWMARLPTLDALAAASEEEALALWSGLGYYQRARRLREAARLCSSTGMPRTAAALRALPGVGPYTAAAVASIAFGEAVAAVDGNVLRVLARLVGERAPVDHGDGRKRLEALAGRLVDPDQPGDWNQALMDLGATVCTPRSPRCGLCPFEKHCAVAHRADGVPVPATRRPPRHGTARFAVVLAEHRVLLRDAHHGLLAGTWLLPGGPGRAALARQVREQTGITVRPGRALRPLRHVFSHRAWTMLVHRARTVGEGAARPSNGARWVPVEELAEAPLATATRKALRHAGVPA